MSITTLRLWERGRSVSLLIAFLLFASLAAMARDPLKGTILDKNGNPIISATINVKGKKISTTSGPDGSFTIEAAPGDVLEITSVGFKTQTHTISADQVIRIVLTESASSLEDVVVVGYGTSKKRVLTGAVSEIKSADLVRTPAVAATAALVGKLPGITFRATDARPGNGTNIQIRNLGNPLYVIDGVPYSNNDGTTAFGFNTGVSGTNIFNQIGMEDIESISILKDGAAAIYGLRAANGVVLVTTKKGKKNESTSINISGYYGLQNFTRFPQPGNAGQYVRGLLEAEQNAGNDPNKLYTPQELAKWETGTEKGYKSYDYMDIVTRPNVPQYYLNASASGGSAKSNYYFSIGHLNQDAILRDFNFKRTNMQANLNASIAKGLQIGTQIRGRIESRHNVGVPGLDDYFNPLLSISSMWPIEPPYANDNPNYINQGHSVNINPATYKNNVTGYIDEVFRSMDVNLSAQYDFKFGLTAKALFSYGYTNEDFDGFEFTYNAYTYNPSTDVYELRTGNQNPWRERHKRNIWSRFGQFQLNYAKQLGDHSITALAAYERSDMENSYLALHSIPPNNYIPTMFFANQDYLGDEWSTEARAGYTGRISYNYQQKYILDAFLRYEGSYLYIKDKRWGLFPGFAVGWRISEESFLKNKLPFLNELKLRGSYGETGSEVGISAFGYLGGYNFSQGSAVLDGTYVIGLRPRGLPITNLSWVNNQSTNIGIDFIMFDNTFSGSFDIWQRKRTGLPAGRYDVLLPSEVGYSLPNENLTSEANLGIDGMLTYSKKSREIDWSVSVNGTLARRKDLHFYKPRFGNSWDLYRNAWEERWGNINWGYQVIGRFQSQEEIDNYTINNDGQGNRSQLPGDFKFKDVNGDGVINGMDERPIGYAEGAQPYLSFGFNGKIAYKGFSLAVDFAGSSMQSFFRNWELRNPFQNNGNSPEYMLTDRWHREDPYDPNSKWIAGTYPALRKDYNHVNFSRKNDFWLTNVRYIRLKNMELAYTFNPKLTKRFGVSNLRVYVNGTNLFSFDNVREFEIDPEISSSNGLVYPQQKLVNFGFNVSFN
ncbi:TonB-dependent receptor [Pseudoflavitalea sp. X16]|uniref:SusC/RagA family TonB-linked outer membrane protein n=1 Tax=Paraflavitalea devenefica TaxID=2716334 RepID=UPI00141DF234|nr:TonB-dependent receptor [Paraflavitalea devenefica]NII26049.1 TonB-dependent receptor [Paraflavitalea devenefica]